MADRSPAWDNLPSNFDPASYLAANPDVAAANIDAADHYLQFGMHKGRRLSPDSP